MNLIRALTILVLLLGPKLSAQVTTILGTDVVSASRTTINNNFNWVNTHIVSAAFGAPTLSDQIPITTSPTAGGWYLVPNCTDTLGQHLNYDPTNPSKWICGTGTIGILSMNGLSQNTQLFAIGTAGTDFNIVSAVQTHTFNFPNASGSNRGLLLASDWATFNGKQSALGYTAENVANKNAASGYAGLDSGSHLLTTLFPVSYPGNSATASALQAVPTQCGANNFSTGIAASGNANCSQPASSNLVDAANILFNNASFVFGSFTQNFAGAAHTIPWKTGLTASLPATCTVGEAYYATDAAAGQQIYQCSTLNSWSHFGTAAMHPATDFEAALAFTPMNPANNLSELVAPATARTNMGVAIGVNVEAWSSVLDAWASKTVPAGTIMDLTSTQTATGKTIDGISPTVFGYLPNITSDVQTQLNSKQASLGYTAENVANKGTASGYAGLDASSHLFTSYFPATYPGNSATATSLQTGPTQCGTNNFSTGIAASGNANCSRPASGNLSDVANIMETIANFQYGHFIADFSLGAHTLPAAVNILANLPGSCTVGEQFFVSNATPGQNLYFCVATNTWKQQLNSGAGSGSLQILVNGSAIASEPGLNFIPNTILWPCVDNPVSSRVDCTPAVQTSAIASITSLQQGDLLTAFSTNGSTGYVASPAIGCANTALKSGMQVWLNVDTTAGAASLNYCNLGQKSIKRSDGASDPLAGEIPALKTFPVVYDGAHSVWVLPQWMDLSVALGRPGPISLTAQTGAIANGTSLCAATLGNCSAAGQYRVTAYFDSTVVCATPGPGAIALNLSWTDEIGARTSQPVPLVVNGAATPLNTMGLGTATTYATATTSFWSTGVAAIGYGVTYTACTSGTGTFASRISVERLQ